METLLEIKDQHQKVLTSIFSLLLQYKILKHHSSTLKSKNPLYCFSKEDFDDSRQTEYHIFKSSINRLLETGFIQIITEESLNTHFITLDDYQKLTLEELNYFLVLEKGLL